LVLDYFTKLSIAELSLFFSVITLNA